jgi:hypothetical protein
MNDFTKLYVDSFEAGAHRKSAELQIGMANANQGKPSILAMLVEKLRMSGLPERLQIVAPAAGIGAGIGGLAALGNEARKTDTERAHDEFNGQSMAGNVAQGALGGALTGAGAGALYSAGRDGTLINPIGKVANLNDKALASIVPPNTTRVSVNNPIMGMDAKGPVSKLLAAVLNNPAALGATAGGVVGAAHGAIAPGRDEEGKQKSRLTAAATHGAAGAGLGGAIGFAAGEAGRHDGILDMAMLRNFNPGMRTMIDPSGAVTNTISR